MVRPLKKHAGSNNTYINKIKDEVLFISTEDLTLEELKDTYRDLYKAYGMDNIPCEVWKTGSFDEVLLDCCNKLFAKLKYGPKAAFYLVQKGRFGYSQNLLAISLSPIASKVYSKMLVNSIYPEMENHL